MPSGAWSYDRHNVSSEYPVDLVCVGDPPDLPLGSDDRTILLWSEREERILTEDKSTMPAHLAAHLDAGHRSGVSSQSVPAQLRPR